MNKIVKIESNNEKKIQLKIKVIENLIFKESFFASQDNIKMKTFFKTNFDLIQKELENSYVIYFLINSIDNKIYVGKSKDFSSRLQNHYKNKNFEKIILLSSNKFTPSIIDYLEYWFIDFFSKSNDFLLENSRIEKIPNTNSVDDELIDNSLENFKWLLLTEGISIDSSRFTGCQQNKNNILNTTQVYDKNFIDVYFQGVKASYLLNESTNKKILLHKDTKIIWNKFSSEEFPGSITSIKRYDNWFENNKINIKQLQENEFILINDLKISASLAACLVSGYFSQNGNDKWKTLDGKSINDLKNK